MGYGTAFGVFTWVERKMGPYNQWPSYILKMLFCDEVTGVNVTFVSSWCSNKFGCTVDDFCNVYYESTIMSEQRQNEDILQRPTGTVVTRITIRFIPPEVRKTTQAVYA
jgi:hypothetical protein